MPNVEGIESDPWIKYRTTLADVERRSGWPLCHASLRIGFLRLRYEREDLAAEQVLERAGLIADCNNGMDVPECEAFYGFLDDLSGDGPALPSALSLNLRIASLFAPHADLARACLVHLDDVSQVDAS